jgi:hypothetical protein
MPERKVETKGGDGGWDSETIMAQIYIAFGQGAGSLYVSRGAIAAGRRQYQKLVAEYSQNWSEVGQNALEYTRSVGRAAAHLAVGEGRNTISADNYAKAAALVRTVSHHAPPPGPLVDLPIGFCPFGDLRHR